jgi:hypothetical protein
MGLILFSFLCGWFLFQHDTFPPKGYTQTQGAVAELTQVVWQYLFDVLKGAQQKNLTTPKALTLTKGAG